MHGFAEIPVVAHVEIWRKSELKVKNEENPDGEIEITFTGLRQGEKMYEELLIGKDVQPTDHSKIMRAEESMIPWEELEPIIEALNKAIECLDSKKIIELFSKTIPEFNPDSRSIDLLHQSNFQRH